MVASAGDETGDSHHALSDRFIARMLVRNARLESDLVDHWFNSSERRLARALLRLARYGTGKTPQRSLPGAIRPSREQRRVATLVTSAPIRI